MKNITFLFFFALLLSVAGCSPAGNASAEFWVRGNCEMCKATIEEALQDLDGVASADYDLESNMVTVSYDSTKLKVSDLHQACAGAGYDTKNVPAVATAYENLPRCCKKQEDM